MTGNAHMLLNGDYPRQWDDFVGQTRAKTMLRYAAASARMRHARMDHVLLVSPTPGCGKTSLAILCAEEIGSGCQIISGKVTVGQARLVLSQMADGDVLVYDEVHLAVAGGKASAESWFLHYLQDGCIVGPRGPEKMPDVTIIGATTAPGALPETLLDRFLLKPELVPYTAEEGAQIALKLAERIFPSAMRPPSREVAGQIAAAASNNPRVMRAVLSTLRDLFMVVPAETKPGKEYLLGQTLDFLGLTEDGLTVRCRKYLQALLIDFGGEPAGARALSDRLQETSSLGHTERLLQEKGFIVLTARGRMLTPTGIRRARTLEGSQKG